MTGWDRKSRLASRPSALKEGVLEGLPSGESRKSTSDRREMSELRKLAGRFCPRGPSTAQAATLSLLPWY